MIARFEKMDEREGSLNLRERMLDVKQCLGCAHEGIVVTDTEGRIVETSPPAERILEMPSLDLKSRSIYEFCGAGDVYGDLCSQAARDGRALNRSILVSTGMGRKKLLNMSVERFGEGTDVRLVHVFQDCADLRTMEQRLLQSERLATVGRFASQIAHEIRNPLNSISLNMELLEDEFKDSESEARGLIRSALRELDRLNGIVNEYLQFARFPKPNLKRGTIESVLQSVVESFRPPARITFTVCQAKTTPAIWLDEQLLRQVIDNLTRNSVEAISNEGSIEIETDVSDRFLVIRVRDSGIGIPESVQSKLFEPFFTTKPHGTGLGLATSQQIMFEHNGHLLVDSQPGKGTTFSLLLPL
jgi:signal transduction histidine kinase